MELRTIHYAGPHESMGSQTYAVRVEGHMACIILIHQAGPGLWNLDETRDSVINRIVEAELPGVRADRITVQSIFAFDHPRPLGIEFDLHDAGGGKFRTVWDKRREIDQPGIERTFAALGYYPPIHGTSRSA